MAYDLGAAVPLRMTVLDGAGEAVNATTVALAITLPDGTSAAPVVANPPADTGVYAYDYPSVQQGRHVVRWTTTGPATGYVDVFYLRSGEPSALVSLADVKNHLNIKAENTDNDGELQDAIDTASDVVESIVGSLARRTVTETYSGNGTPGLALRRPPVISVTSVTVEGAVLDPSGYSLSDAGVLYRVSGYTDLLWPRGRNNIAVAYVVGAPGQVIRPAVLDSVKELVRINFRPQLGGNYSPFDQGATSDSGSRPGQTRLGFFVPDRIEQLLERHNTMVGFG